MTSTKRALMTAATTLDVLAKRLPDRNRYALPRLTKITVSVGVGRAKEHPKLVETVVESLKMITGQQPILTRARTAIAGFKLRGGDVVGLQVTLRGTRMWDFLNRLVLVTLPRLRDFHGLSRSGLDQQGNYSLGIREQTVFPEIQEESVSVLHGVGIALTTSATSRADGEALLSALGLPLTRATERPGAAAGVKKE